MGGAAPHMLWLGHTNFRGQHRPFGVPSDADLARHALVIGRTGTGKSTLMENIAIQLARDGRGFCVIDPHAVLVANLLDRLPRHRSNDVILFDVEDDDYPIGFNPLAHVDHDKHRVVSQIVDLFKHVWGQGFLDRSQDLLNNALHSLMDIEQATLLWVDDLFTDEKRRQWVAARTTDPLVRKFWVRQYPELHKRFRQEIIYPVQNKLRRLVTAAPLRNILGQVANGFDMRDVIQQNRILLVNLSRPTFGPDKATFLASLLIEKIFWTTLEHRAQGFTLLVDEAAAIANPVIANIVSESRKFGLQAVFSVQYLASLDPDIRAALLGTVGTLVAFQMGAGDAETLAVEFAPEFAPHDMVNLPLYHVCLKLSVHGSTSRPFSAVTLPPIAARGDEAQRDHIIRTSRERYGTPRAIVEERIARWLRVEHPLKHP